MIGAESQTGLNATTTNGAGTDVEDGSHSEGKLGLGAVPPNSPFQPLVKEVNSPKPRVIVEDFETNQQALVTPLLRNEVSTMRRMSGRRVVLPGAPTDHESTTTEGVCCGLKYTPAKSGTWQYQAYLTYLTLGIIFGDIGTSPLYMYSTCFTSPPTQDDVLGVTSLVVWSMLLLIPFKYATFILMADDHGEGGTFALLALLKRGLRNRLKSETAIYRWEIFFTGVTLAGIGCVLADGVLTPAISVLGAIAGLGVASPDVTYNVVVGVSAAILAIFFLFQRFGTHRISFLFSPITVLWFLALLGIGIYNITFNPIVFSAFNPALGINYFLVNGPPSFQILGGVFLTVTGGEALYADIGHFNVKAVRTSTICFVVPCLIICYLGQAAAIITDPTVITNTFYLTIPTPLFYPMLVLATLASIIASQAMVSASYSIFAQGMRLHYIPRLTVVHTNPSEFGQVYIPEVNWVLMILTIIVVVAYQNSTALGYAYGVTVSFAFFTTTLLFSFITYFNFNRPWIFGLISFLFFGFIDFTFFVANLYKFVQGGWFSVTLMLIVFLLLCIWRWGRQLMVAKQLTMNISDAELYHEKPLFVFDSNLIVCYSSSADSVPASFVHFLRRMNIRPRNLVFVTVSSVNVPYVFSDIEVKRFETHDFIYRATIRYGYAQPPVPAERVVELIASQINCVPEGFDFFPPRTEDLFKAINPTFITGHDRVITKPKSGFVRRFIVEFFSFLQSFSRSPVNQFAIPDENNIEIGVVVPI